jgi:hypothetical protein
MKNLKNYFYYHFKFKKEGLIIFIKDLIKKNNLNYINIILLPHSKAKWRKIKIKKPQCRVQGCLLSYRIL